MTKEELCVKFVEDFAKFGFRIDTNPTRMFRNDTPEILGAQADEYAWWSEYVRGAEDRLRFYAKQAIAGNDIN